MIGRKISALRNWPLQQKYMTEHVEFFLNGVKKTIPSNSLVPTQSLLSYLRNHGLVGAKVRSLYDERELKHSFRKFAERVGAALAQ